MTVYFIQQQGPGGEVKIGYTASLDVHPRVRNIQTSSAYPVRVLAVIPHATTQDERALHQLHRRDRIHAGGEWFRPSPAVMESVAKAKARTDKARAKAERARVDAVRAKVNAEQARLKKEEAAKQRKQDWQEFKQSWRKLKEDWQESCVEVEAKMEAKARAKAQVKLKQPSAATLLYGPPTRRKPLISPPVFLLLLFLAVFIFLVVGGSL